MKIKNNNSRVVYFDLLRVICTFSVVILHTAGYAWPILSYADPEWAYVNFYNGFFRFSVPVFIMMSGAFMLSNERDLDIKNLYCKKILRLVKLFIVYSSFYAVATNLQHAISFDLTAFIKQIVLGHYHLWYLYAIVGLYIMTPLLRAITKSNLLTKYFLIIAFLIEILIGTVDAIVKSVNLSILFSKSYLYFVKGFTIYYVAGYFIYNNKLSGTRFIYVLGVAASAVTIAGTSWYSAYTMENSDVFYSFLSVNVFLQSIAIFVFFKEKISNVKFSSFLENWIKTLSKYSLGVYLIHVFFLMLLSQLDVNCLSFNPLFSIPVISILICASSYLTIILIGNIPIVKHIFY